MKRKSHPLLGKVELLRRFAGRAGNATGPEQLALGLADALEDALADNEKLLGIAREYLKTVKGEWKSEWDVRAVSLDQFLDQFYPVFIDISDDLRKQIEGFEHDTKR